jgi:hypothetical protein
MTAIKLVSAYFFRVYFFLSGLFVLNYMKFRQLLCNLSYQK